MNAKVKVMAFSAITAMFILALTAGTAYAACGGFDQSGQVYYKSSGDPVMDLHEEYNMTVTNLNTSQMWYKGDGILTISGYNYYTMTSTRPLASPYDDRNCAWITGDVAKYEVWKLDGTYENTTYHTMTDADMIAAKYALDIYVEAAEETYSKELPVGWNLISLPLTPSDNSTSAVLGGTSTIEYSAVWSYNATSPKGWNNELHPTGTMDPGKGYFVNATTAGTWNYSGTPYTQMNVSLEPGLNMVGWLNCSKSVGDTSVNDTELVVYAITLNAMSQKYEAAYNPAAPPVFNEDFTTMERGTGYFISAWGSGWLNESC